MYTGTLPPASNRGAYRQLFQLYDDETEQGLDLAGAAVVLELRRTGCAQPALSATVANGRIVLGAEAGVFEVAIAAGDMRSLAAETYGAGITVTLNGETTQYFIGTLPVLDGIVS